MKKLYLLIFTLIFMLPISVSAAEPVVVSVSATASGSTINYSGTTEDGMTAVMCKLYNSSNKELLKLSSPVDNKTFTGSFTNVENGTYTVKCAKYEGGHIEEALVTVGDSTIVVDPTTPAAANTTSDQTSTDKTNPQTYDAGIKGSIILLIISTIGIIGSIIYLKNKKTSK